MKRLLAVVGPTASGKTELAIRLAKHLNTEIISADSRQFFKELKIGSASPTEEELKKVKHHFIGSHSIQDTMNAGIYESLANKTLSELFQRYTTLVLVGGSGMYIDAVCEGFDVMPDIPMNIREQLNEELKSKGLSQLQIELKEKDPEYYAQVDKQNPQRIIRALEIIRASNKKFSSFRNKNKVPREFSILKIGIDIPRENLYERINTRVDQMMNEGLLEEARNVYPFRHLPSLQTVGYKEFFPFFENQCSLDFAIQQLKQNTRNFAKRQMTWFRKDKSIHWFKDFESAIKYVDSLF